MGTLNDLLSTVTPQEGSPVSQEELLANLVRQNMTQGLGVNSDIGGHQGQLTFSGPVAGYSGALRPSDVPDMKAAADIPVIYGGKQGMRISPGTEMARVEAGGPFRGVLPDAQAQQLSQGLAASEGQYPAGSQAKVAEGILQKYGLVEDPTTKLIRSLSVKDAFKDREPLGIDKAGKIFRYNPENNQFETPPPNITDIDAQKAGFRTYTDKQREAVSSLGLVKETFNQLVLNKRAADDAADKSSLGQGVNVLDKATGGRLGGQGVEFDKARANFTTAFDQLIGGQRGAASPMLTKIRLEVLPKLYTEKGTSDELLRQMGDLVDKLVEGKRDTILGVRSSDIDKQLQGSAAKVLEASGIGSQSRRSIPTSGAQQPAAPSTEKTVTVSSPEEASKLPSGTLFTTPDGQTRRKR